MTDFAKLVLAADTRQMTGAEKAIDKVTAAGGRAEKGMDRLNKETKQASASVSGLSKTTSTTSAALGRMAGTLTAAVAAVVGIRRSIDTIKEFGTSMSQVAAITRATSSDLETMRDVARRLGETTEFSAAQAADGLKFLGMAGFDAKESVEAISSVLDLATASSLGLASAADISSNVLSGFGLAAKDAGQVADVLAAASSRANTDVSQLGSAMSTVAPISAALGINLQDTAAAVGVMSDAGIQGERAGTALRGVLASLAGPTKQASDALDAYGLSIKDVNPETHSLSEIMATLQERGLSTADAMTIFGREAASGALVLVEGNKRLKEFGQELLNAEGAAMDMAKTMRDNLRGDIEGLKSALSGLIISIGDAGVEGGLRNLVQAMTDAVRFINGNLTPAVAFVSDNLDIVGVALAGLVGSQIPAMISGVGTLTVAMRGLAVASWAATGPWGLLAGLVAAAGAAFVTFKGNTSDMKVTIDEMKAAQDAANTQMVVFSTTYAPAAGKAAIDTANDYLELAKAAREAAAAQLANMSAEASRIQDMVDNGHLRNLTIEEQALMSAKLHGAQSRLTVAEKAYNRALEARDRTVSKVIKNDGKMVDATKDINSQIDVTVTTSNKAASAVKDLGDKLDGATQKMPEIVDRLGDAWGDFVVDGFRDFQGFVNSVLGSFKNMIAQMIATAAKARIMQYLGLGGSVAGAATSAAAGGMGQSLVGSAAGNALSGTAIGTALAGAGAGFQAALGIGGYASAGLFNVGANAALASATTGAGALATTIGAVAAPVLAVAAAVSFFSKKTKELDSGLMVTVANMDAFVESFQTIKTTRFWGLSSKTSTSLSEVGAEISDPIVQAVQSIQKTVIDASASFGIAESAFDNFFYDMEISLKGLTEDQKLAKINEELGKMGDEFASLTGHFSNMNELIEATNQRLELQNRLDQLLGNSSAILARQRAAELASMHKLNRPFAEAVYNLEDAQTAVTNAFTSLRASIDNVVSDLQEKLSVANSAVNISRSIIGKLEQALSSRTIARSVSQTFARRSSALNFLRAGDFRDEKALDDALKIVGEPTEQLYGSFVDYARDFYKTSNVIEDAKKTAETQLTADEKQVDLLEQQIADAESQYQVMVDQYNALLGIDTSVKSVEEAVGTLRGAIEALAAAQAAAKAAATAAVDVGDTGGSFAEQFGTGQQYQGYDLAKLSGSADLLNAAGVLGIGTTGKTGAEIQQAISNATQMAVNLDDATRARKFAMGGKHSGGFRIVGEKGPELEYTGPSQIIPNDKISIGGGDPALRREVSKLREDLSNALIQIAKYTRKSSDTLNKFDYQGLPSDRGF